MIQASRNRTPSFLSYYLLSGHYSARLWGAPAMLSVCLKILNAAFQILRVSQDRSRYHLSSLKCLAKAKNKTKAWLYSKARSRLNNPHTGSSKATFF